MDRRPTGAIPIHLLRIPWQPLLIGATAFVLVTGGEIIFPNNVRWLLTGDLAMNQLGWMFYRNAPILQQPFGANWQFGMDLSSSTVYSDSISLFAFPFKLFKAWLPEQFQYFGLWIFVSFILQALFAWKLLGRLTQDRDGLWLRSVATIFFVIAPVFVWRIHWHIALGSHWLLLAALYLYFSPGLRARSWIILLIVASLVTPIILAMDLIIFAAALARQYFSRELLLSDAAKTVAVLFLFLVPVLWEGGYFMVSEVGSTGFGTYRTSLLGFIDPGAIEFTRDHSWSYIFPDQPQASGNYEGFCFLGAGMIGLTIFALGRFLLSGVRETSWTRFWPILLVFAFSILFALSNNIGAGPNVYVHYPVPFILERAISPFRASGRFIWIAYYLLIAGVLAFVLRAFRRVFGALLLCVCLAVQIVDSGKALSRNRRLYETDYDPGLLNSSFWQNAAKKYDKVMYIPPAYAVTGFVPLCYFAALHHLPISLCRYGRTDEEKLVTARLQYLDEIAKHGFDRKALYVFETPAIWARELPFVRSGDWTGIVDGYRVVAPDWTASPRPDIATLIHDSLFRYSFGDQLLFHAEGNGIPCLANGWVPPENWGVWSDGPESLLMFQLTDEPRSAATLDLDGFSFVNPVVGRQVVGVFVNSVKVGELVYTNAYRPESRLIQVPRETLADHDRVVEIKFLYSAADSPARLGLYLDPRIMAFGLKSLVLKQDEK
jgi:Family of unknown function (DUF6311)